MILPVAQLALDGRQVAQLDDGPVRLNGLILAAAEQLLVVVAAGVGAVALRPDDSLTEAIGGRLGEDQNRKNDSGDDPKKSDAPIFNRHHL